MPSDCQCSTACDTKVVKVKEVLNNKKATALLRKLEKEVEALKNENSRLESRLSRGALSKKDIIKSLKKHLDKV